MPTHPQTASLVVTYREALCSESSGYTDLARLSMSPQDAETLVLSLSEMPLSCPAGR